MDRDINFCLAILKQEYDDMKNVVVSEELSSIRRSDILNELELILGGFTKIECMFKGDRANDA